MLSYQHAYHVGNHADVLKHWLLTECLSYLAQKPKGLSYIDTHAGRGFYPLDAQESQKIQEYTSGIAKLWKKPLNSPGLVRYRQWIESFNPSGQLEVYPGSPLLAEAILKKSAASKYNLTLFERHPQEWHALRHNTQGKKSFHIHQQDGYQGLLGQLPPPWRRALVLMDPPYEIKTDYQAVVHTLKKAYEKFPQGTYLLWYPVVQRAWNERLEQAIKRSSLTHVQLYELAMKPDSPGKGMSASGMILVNPPWTLAQTVPQALAELKEVLGGYAYRAETLVRES